MKTYYAYCVSIADPGPRARRSPVYIENVPNRNSPPAVLLRMSRREGKRVVKKTIANLTPWPMHVVDALRRSLAGERLVSAEDVFVVERSMPHGARVAQLDAGRGTRRRRRPGTPPRRRGIPGQHGRSLDRAGSGRAPAHGVRAIARRARGRPGHAERHADRERAQAPGPGLDFGNAMEPTARPRGGSSRAFVPPNSRAS